MACPGHWWSWSLCAHPPRSLIWPRPVVVVAGRAGYAARACGSCSASSRGTAVRRLISTRSPSSAWSGGPVGPALWAERHVCKGEKESSHKDRLFALNPRRLRSSSHSPVLELVVIVLVGIEDFVCAHFKWCFVCEIPSLGYFSPLKMDDSYHNIAFPDRR